MSDSLSRVMLEHMRALLVLLPASIASAGLPASIASAGLPASIASAGLPASIATAAPLEMRYQRSENLHIANQGGAINWFDEVAITLELQAGGKVAGKETGKMREHNLYDRYTTEELQTWTHAWRGTWKQTGAALALDVVLDARQCTHTKKPSDGALAQLACGKVSPKIHFDCTSTQVSLHTMPNAKRDVWQCVPTGSPDLDRTPSMWVFGKTSCVKMLGGRGFSYDAC